MRVAPHRHAVSVLLFVFAFVIRISATQRERYTLYRAVAPNQEAFRALLDLQLNDHLFNVDFWKAPRSVADPADVMVAESIRELIEQHFAANDIQYNVTVPDVEKLILRNEGKRSNLGFGKRLNDDPILDSEPDEDWTKVGRIKKAKYPFGDYAPYAEMIKYMRTIEFYYPSLAKIVRIGTTHEGRPIEGLKIGFPVQNTNKRAIWIDGNIHAREWASSHTALYIINQLVSGYKKDANITHYVNSLNFFIVPCLNPDGYEYTRSSPAPLIRLWRKNRSPEVCSASLWGGEKCCQGVDLNRNFDHFWAQTGSSYEHCSNLYHGDYVFSEPEANSVKNYLSTDEMWGKVDAFITLHTYAQLWIYPFSHTERSYPRDIEELRRTAKSAIDRLENVYGTVYRMGTGADTLAPASGGSDDWAKSRMNIKFVYLIELRPEEHLSHGFILHKKELIPTGVETLEGLKEVFEAVLDHNHIKRDPLSKITEAMRRKQDLRLRMMHSQRELFHATPRTSIWIQASTSAPTSTTTPTTTPTTSATTTAALQRPQFFGSSQQQQQARASVTERPQETTQQFRRPTVPLAPPTFNGQRANDAGSTPATAGTDNKTPTTRSPDEVERLRLEQKRLEAARKKDMEERRREVEETRRRVKLIEERKLREAENDKRRAAGLPPLEEPTSTLATTATAEETSEQQQTVPTVVNVDPEQQRIELARRQEEQWRRDNQRRLDAIRYRDAEDRRREEERVRELQQAQLEKELQKEKENSETALVRLARRLNEPAPLGGKNHELLEVHNDKSQPVEAVVTLVEMSVTQPTPPSTTSAQARISTEAYRVFTRGGVREVTLQGSEAEPETKSTYAPPRITQRWDQRFTTQAPVAFRDPHCRDLRYSCAFWLRSAPDACVTQRSFMRAQCAYTCRFCEPSIQ